MHTYIHGSHASSAFEANFHKELKSLLSSCNVSFNPEILSRYDLIFKSIGYDVGLAGIGNYKVHGSPNHMPSPTELASYGGKTIENGKPINPMAMAKIIASKIQASVAKNKNDLNGIFETCGDLGVEIIGRLGGPTNYNDTIESSRDAQQAYQMLMNVAHAIVLENQNHPDLKNISQNKIFQRKKDFNKTLALPASLQSKGKPPQTKKLRSFIDEFTGTTFERRKAKWK